MTNTLIYPRRDTNRYLNQCASSQQAGPKLWLPLRIENLVELNIASVFYISASMSDLSVNLTAPNGRTYTQPLGLFINNEFLKSSSGQTITSIDPAYVNLQ